MKKAYLIISPEMEKVEIVRKFYFYRWDWKDTIEETAQSPWTWIAFDSDTETYIYWREENKDVFASRYFYAQGEEIEPVLDQLKKDMALLTPEDLIQGLTAQKDAYKRGSMIYQLGIANTGKAFDKAAGEAFKASLKDSDRGVRIAALWGLAWVNWKQMRPVIEETAANDEAEEVRRTAQMLLNAPETEN